MHTTPVTQTSPKVLVDKDAALAAAFQMLCERMGKLEETAEHWLRRKREMEWWRDGILDSQLLGLDRDVELCRDFPRPTCAPPRPLKEQWKFVNITMSDLTTPANLDMNETRRVKTLEAMARLGLQGRLLRRGKTPLQCADVGLESDFIYLADAVPEEMVRAAVEREPGLTLVGYATHEVQPSLFLENSVPESPESWIRLASRLFNSCGIAAGACKSLPSALTSCASSCPITEADLPHQTKAPPCSPRAKPASIASTDLKALRWWSRYSGTPTS